MAIDMIRIDRETGVQPDGGLVERFIITVGKNDVVVATEEGFLISPPGAPEFSEVVDFMTRALLDLIEAKRDGKSFTTMP